MSVSAKGPSDQLVFAETQFLDVREGYVSLSWNSIDSAAEYVVSDSDGDVPYRGAFPQAFVSGMSDGEYIYGVEAYDAAGQRIAMSAVPATVVVQHWPLWQAMTLFSIGLVVFLIIIALIARGWISDGADAHRGLPTTGEPSP